MYRLITPLDFAIKVSLRPNGLALTISGPRSRFVATNDEYKRFCTTGAPTYDDLRTSVGSQSTNCNRIYEINELDDYLFSKKKNLGL